MSGTDWNMGNGGGDAPPPAPPGASSLLDALPGIPRGTFSPEFLDMARRLGGQFKAEGQARQLRAHELASLLSHVLSGDEVGGPLRVTIEHEEAGAGGTPAPTGGNTEAVNAARAMVAALQTHGFPPDDLRALVLHFQRTQRSLHADGIYGPLTRAAAARVLGVSEHSLPPPLTGHGEAPTLTSTPDATTPAGPPPAPPGAPPSEPTAPPPQQAAPPPQQPAPQSPAPAPSELPTQGTGTRDQRAELGRTISQPLLDVLTLAETLSMALPTTAQAGSGTRAELVPLFDNLSSLMQEGGAAALEQSRNLDAFNPTAPTVTLAGVEICGDLVADVHTLLADAQARAAAARDAIVAYAIEHPVGLVRRIGESAKRLLDAVRRRAESIRSSFGDAAQRLSDFLFAWSDRMQTALDHLFAGIGGTMVAGSMLAVALALLAFVLLTQRPRRS